MPVDKNLVGKKLDFLNQFLVSIENMDFDEDAFVKSSDIHDLVVFRLQQAVETCIDIATMIISQLNLPRKETAKDAFLLLGENGVIDNDLGKKMGKAADFRNRVVHGYNDFDYKLLYKDYKKDLTDLRNFGSQILAFLEKKS